MNCPQVKDYVEVVFSKNTRVIFRVLREAHPPNKLYARFWCEVVDSEINNYLRMIIKLDFNIQSFKILKWYRFIPGFYTINYNRIYE